MEKVKINRENLEQWISFPKNEVLNREAIIWALTDALSNDENNQVLGFEWLYTHYRSLTAKYLEHVLRAHPQLCQNLFVEMDVNGLYRGDLIVPVIAVTAFVLQGDEQKKALKYISNYTLDEEDLNEKLRSMLFCIDQYPPLKSIIINEMKKTNAGFDDVLLQFMERFPDWTPGSENVQNRLDILFDAVNCLCGYGKKLKLIDFFFEYSVQNDELCKLAMVVFQNMPSFYPDAMEKVISAWDKWEAPGKQIAFQTVLEKAIDTAGSLTKDDFQKIADFLKKAGSFMAMDIIFGKNNVQPLLQKYVSIQPACKYDVYKALSHSELPKRNELLLYRLMLLNDLKLWQEAVISEDEKVELYCFLLSVCRVLPDAAGEDEKTAGQLALTILEKLEKLPQIMSNMDMSLKKIQEVFDGEASLKPFVENLLTQLFIGNLQGVRICKETNMHGRLKNFVPDLLAFDDFCCRYSLNFKAFYIYFGEVLEIERSKRLGQERQAREAEKIIKFLTEK